jgi:hypothetical protein
MDLRFEFDQILAQYGHDCLLVRTDTKTRCSCWNEKKQESDRNCPICFGISWVPIVEKHTVRNMQTGLTQQDPMFGNLDVVLPTYWFRNNANIAKQNLIVEVDWSPSGKPVYNGGNIFQVQNIDKKMFEGGQVIFQRVTCKDQPINKHIRGIRIANVNGIIKYEIAAEGGLG